MYEVCKVKLRDRRLCLYGVEAQRLKSIGIPLPGNLFSQDWKEQECSPIGQDKNLYSFSALVVGETIQFWEEIGK